MTPPRSGLAALLVIPVLWVAVVSAAASNSTNPTADASATVTLAPSLTCAAVNSGDVCNVQSVCTRCVRTPGCAFDTFVRQCVALPVDGSALYTGSVNAPFNRTDLHYCADGDTGCAACAVTPSTPFCEGADGACVCPSVCDVVKGDSVICDDEGHSNTVYIVLAVVGTMVPLFVWIHGTFVRAPPSDTATDGDVRTEQRRLGVAQGERAQPKSALALQLHTWRSHHDEHKGEIDKVEPLRSGYVLMETDEPTAASSSDATRMASGSAHTAVSAAVDTRGERDGDWNAIPVQQPSTTARTATTEL